MFFVFPSLSPLPNLIYVLAAVLPAFFLLRYVYRHDTIEKEPFPLLLSLLGMGCLSALCAAGVEAAAEGLLASLVDPSAPVLYTVLLAFLVIAVAEESAKLFFLKLRTWRHPAFNYRFDGVVYAVFVSLGFAALENVQYVVNYGLSVALPRALLAIPGHMSFAVFLGVYYGRAKLLENCGDRAGARRRLWTGWLFAVFLHGFYDACAMIGTVWSSAVFLVFVILLFFAAFRTLKRESVTDAPISPADAERDEGGYAL